MIKRLLILISIYAIVYFTVIGAVIFFCLISNPTVVSVQAYIVYATFSFTVSGLALLAYIDLKE